MTQTRQIAEPLKVEIPTGGSACDVTADKLKDDLDQAASASTRRSINEHLAKCPGCAKALQEIETTRLLLNRLPRSAPPGHLLRSILQHIHKHTTAHSTTSTEHPAARDAEERAD